jgi:DNA/RNA endonuclease YhcR with UshA esterase domain
MKIITLLIPAFFFATSSWCQAKVSIDSVSLHIGDSVTVCSKVFNSRYLERSVRQPTFLDLGADYPNSLLTVVIFGENREKFTGFPEVLFAHKNICVTGRLQDYKGRPEIIVSSPDQIKLE